jgi:hypothetical protein
MDSNAGSNTALENPPGWGADPLSAFVETARQNTLATFMNLRSEYWRLNEIDSVYCLLLANLFNTPEWASAFFLLRAHCSYLAGARLALSGQVAESYMPLRGCLEAALYGLHISRYPAAGEMWARRHENSTWRSKVRAEFSINNVFRTLESVDRNNAEIARELYERTIDYGAHPNERAFLSNMQKIRKGGNIEFRLIYLTGDNPPLRLALKTTAQVGVCAFDIFETIFRIRVTSLGIDRTLRMLKKGL